MRRTKYYPQFLRDSDTVAVIGGGPAGAFSALHLLTQARRRGTQVRVVIFESRCQPNNNISGDSFGTYVGCPKCAGGISPRLYDALQSMGIHLPPEIVQASIGSITVQGKWKKIQLPVPRDRRICSVYRGMLPHGQTHSECFDAMMLDIAMKSGAELIGSRVRGVSRDPNGSLMLKFQINGVAAQLNADFVIFAGGVNDKPDTYDRESSLNAQFQQLQPLFRPPRLRKALIFELEAPATLGETLQGELHFIECSTPNLQLEMCSILSKRRYITVTLIGRSVDRAESHQQNMEIVREFLALRRTREALPQRMETSIRCICNPKLVVGAAVRPFGERIAAVGDMATSRQYKDGILSAHAMAQGLIAAIFDEGVDEQSLEAGYGPIIADFRRDNQYAALIFFLYRWFFSSYFLSRVIYQTFASEKKTKPEKQRVFKKIFWNISSGDSSYRNIAWSMLRPTTLWLILKGGIYVTLRNSIFEWLFGLDWSGIRRVPTAVSRRELKAKRSTLLSNTVRERLFGRIPEFECMYAINIHETPATVRALLAKLGEADRPYLNPRWVSIRRASGEPLQAGVVIRYSAFGGFIAFAIELQPGSVDGLLMYQVRGGFAHGGTFVFEVEPMPNGHCQLTIYLAFDYARGNNIFQRLYCQLFKLMFPEFIHDVLWNHALCELKQVAEEKGIASLMYPISNRETAGHSN